MNNISRIVWFVIMDNKVTIFSPEYQAKLDKKIRTKCLNSLIKNGGVYKTGSIIGINPKTLWNQLTDGRNKWVPAVTVALVSAFTENIQPLDRLCRVANHVALPIIGVPGDQEDTGQLASDILGDLASMIRNKKDRQETGRDLIRRAYTLAHRGKG